MKAFPRIAAAGFVAYLLVSLLVGEWFPFTQLPMYSELSGYRTSQVLVCRLAGEEIPCDGLQHVEGVSPRAIQPLKGRRFSMGYRIQELRAQLERQGDAPPGEGSAFEVGFRPVDMGPDGPEMGDFVAVQSGRAWRMP